MRERLSPSVRLACRCARRMKLWEQLVLKGASTMWAGARWTIGTARELLKPGGLALCQWAGD